MKDEVTRVESVRYLAGASGHAVFSLVFIGGGGLLWATGDRAVGLGAFAAALLVSANGISIYAWRRLNDHFEGRESGDEGPSRTLTGPSISGEVKGELAAGFAIVGAFLVVVGVFRVGLAVLDVRSLGYLVVATLAVGNVAGLAWAYYSGVEG